MASIAVKSDSASIQKGAYVTFLAGSGDYVKGCVGLAKGLRKVGSPYPLIVAILDDVPEEHRQLLRYYGCEVRVIDPIEPEGTDSVDFAMAYYVINYSKLQIWKFEEYEKLIYLDSDIMVYQNIDHLFDLPNGQFYAVMDCFCEPTWSHSPQFQIKYCQHCPERNQWPEHMGEPPAKYFNAGMFVTEPSVQSFEQMMVALRSSPPTLFAEQDFLNKFFENIYTPLPIVYNLVLAMLWRHPENVDLENTKVVHYCAQGSKPWRFTGEEENMDRADITMLVDKWWKIYNNKSLEPSAADHSSIPRMNNLEKIASEEKSLIAVPPAA